MPVMWEVPVQMRCNLLAQIPDLRIIRPDKPISGHHEPNYDVFTVWVHYRHLLSQVSVSFSPEFMIVVLIESVNVMSGNDEDQNGKNHQECNVFE